MTTTILLISDIHANYPALKPSTARCRDMHFDLILNCGDSTVYATFPNETLDWLRAHKVVSILGNTDVKMLRLLAGKKMKKPRKAEKRIMYTWTAEQLTLENREFLAAMPNRMHPRYARATGSACFTAARTDDNEHLCCRYPSIPVPGTGPQNRLRHHHYRPFPLAVSQE